MKLGDMSEREIIIFMLGEVRACKKSILQNTTLLKNHLHTHMEQTEKRENRRWKLQLALVIAGIATATAVVIALL